MDFGITLPTPADSWKTVKRAEDAGFSTAWFYDTQVLSADIFVAMGAAAVKTDRIRLGTGVLIPSNRIVPVAANGLASLNALAPGRILAGFGTGFTGRRSIGLGPYKVSDMRDYIRAVTAMLRGETPEILIEGKARKVGFLNPETGLINIKDPIPVSISALGPRTRRLTAELDADGSTSISARNFQPLRPGTWMRNIGPPARIPLADASSSSPSARCCRRARPMTARG
jgi:5,10-methylenetetrahydromethanopterin reductase